VNNELCARWRVMERDSKVGGGSRGVMSEVVRDSKFWKGSARCVRDWGGCEERMGRGSELLT